MTEARYLDARAVADYLMISRTMVDQLVDQGKLPAPVKLTPRLLRWDRHAIDKALAGAPVSMQPGRTASDIARNIADGLAQRGAARQKAAGRR